jgi:hypothetical protein
VQQRSIQDLLQGDLKRPREASGLVLLRKSRVSPPLLDL